MRCRYCHNADTFNPLLGTEMSADELIKTALRYKTYWKDGGGITVSGGEPLLQIEFLTELFEKAKALDISTCVDTSGQPFSREEPFFSWFEKLCRLTDLFMVDIKHIDPLEHKKLTGHTNENILDMLNYLSQSSRPVWIRHVLVPDITDNDEYLRRTRRFIDTLDNVRRVEVLPYHSMGAYKWKQQGLEYTLENVSAPSEERIKNAESILCD